MAARPSAIVTDAELSVLDVLWEQRGIPVRQIAHAIYGQNTAAYHATVNSLRDQLEAKGFVQRDRSGFAHTFEASVERNTVIGQQIQQLADSHFEGAISPMLLALVERLELKPRDLKAIQRIIDQLD